MNTQEDELIIRLFYRAGPIITGSALILGTIVFIAQVYIRFH